VRNYATFIERLSSDTPRQCYAFLGEEDYLKDEAERVLIERLTKEHGGDGPERVVHYANDADPDELEQLCSYASMFGGLRLLILAAFERWTAQQQKRFLGFLGANALPNGIVLIIRSNDRRLSTTPKGMMTHVFWKFFPRDLQVWISRRLNKSQLSYQPEVPAMMAEIYAGEDVKTLRILAGEVDKLALYFGPGGKVAVDDIRNVCADAPKAEWFRFLDAVTQRRHREAMALARDYLEINSSGVVGFLAALAGRLSDLAIVKSVGEQIGPPFNDCINLARRRTAPRLRKTERDAIDRQLQDMRDGFSVGLELEVGRRWKYLRPWSLAMRCCEADGFTMGELEAAIIRTTQVEHKLKSSACDPNVELDILISQICIRGL